MRKTVKQILMDRDEMTASEANAHIENVQEMINDVSSGDFVDVIEALQEMEGIIADELQLEPDYLDEFIF